MPGPLSSSDLQALWEAVTDPTYSRSILEADEGFEVIEQAIAQYERASLAADRSSQSLYVLPHSGQSSQPAAGAAKARAGLRISRVGAHAFAVVLDPRVVRVEEVATDFGKDGPAEVLTGRRYELTGRVVLCPGEAGPLSAQVEAERAGSGFNNPLGELEGADGTAYAGALRAFHEPGAGLSNEGASVDPGAASHRLRAGVEADVPVPGHVGQQVLLQAGANAGQLRRAVGYLPPEPGDGGSLLLAATAVLAVSSAGAFAIGERVSQASGARGTFLRLAQGRMVVDGDGLVEFGAATITGELSGATATVDVVEQGALMAAEQASASWRVVPLAELGIEASNPLPPEGGDDAVLDLLGDERRVRRAPGEPDDDYRRRVASPADVVSPMAIVRASNRALAPYGVEASVREVGTAAFPGARFDGDDYFDTDFVTIAGAASGTFLDGELIAQDASGGALAVGRAVVRSPAVAGPPPQPLPPPELVGVARVGRTPFASGAPIVGLRSGAQVAAPTVTGGPRPEDDYRLQLDYVEFRAFLLVGAAVGGLGEFGVAYDAGPHDGYDVAPRLNAYDGQPLTTALALRSLWQAVNEVKAGGVGFDVVLEGPQ